MQHKVHMQDQITNRIEIIMEEQKHWLIGILEDLTTLSFVLSIVTLGIVW